MYYIKAHADADGNYGNPHYPAHEGDVELPDILLDSYVGAKGFVLPIIENGVVTALDVNTAAKEAWEAAHPDTPAPPTDLERIEAQVLYTALMTDTLIEEE